MNPMLRALCMAAIAGGVLRVAGSFVTHMFSPSTLAALYFLTDICLLAGIAGLYWSRRSSIGIAGTLGVAIFALGILFVRASALGVLGPNGYQFAAAIALVGLAILSVESLLRRNGANVSAVLWLLSLALGVVATLGFMPAAMILLAGVAFGVGFAAAGAEALAA